MEAGKSGFVPEEQGILESPKQNSIAQVWLSPLRSRFLGLHLSLRAALLECGVSPIVSPFLGCNSRVKISRLAPFLVLAFSILSVSWF